MKLVYLLALIWLSPVLAQTPSVFDRNCESYAREKKFIAPKSVLDLDKNTERYFIYDNLTPSYGKMVEEVNKFAPGYYKTPNRAPIQACAGKALNQCLAFKAYCTETIAKAAVKEDLAEWKVVATNCQNPKYRAKNPASHCQNDALKQLQYVYDQTMHLAKYEAKKNPEAARFFKESAKEFAKYRDNLKALLAEQKKIEDQRKHELEQKELQKELAQSMKNCADVVENDGDDVENRNIANKIVSGIGCKQELGSLKQPQIEELKKDIDNILDHINTKVVLNQTNAIALEKTATAYWASKRQLDGTNLDSEQAAIKLVCAKNPELCANALSKKTLSDSYKKSKNKLKSIVPLSETETTRLLKAEFNPLVAEINSLCRQANTEWFDLHPVKEIDQYAAKIDNVRVAKFDDLRASHTTKEKFDFGEKLLTAGHVSIQNKFSALLNSKLGHLMMSKTLQEKVGVFNPANFRASCAGGSGQLLTPASVADLKVAKKEFAELLDGELEKITEAHDAEGAGGRKEALETYLKSNPLTIVELLKKNPSPDYAKLMCHLIRDINNSDENWQYFKTGVAIVGTVAAVALGATGVGAPAGAALFAAVTMTTVVSATASLDDYFTAKNEAQLSRQSGATDQDTKTGALDNALKQETKADESFKEFATTVVLEGAGFAGGKLLKVFKGAPNQGAITHAADDIINHSDDVLHATDNVIEASDDVVKETKIITQKTEVVTEAPVQKMDLEKETFEQIDVQYDIPRKTATRLQLEDLSEKNQAYYKFIAEKEPNVGREIVQQRSKDMERLAQMYDNNNPNDMKYLVKTKKSVKSDFSGGEADLYLNPKNKNEVLKVWHENRLGDFEQSTRAMLHYEEKVSKNANIAKYFSVSKIKEKGPNYIVKEFSQNSTELKNVQNLSEVQFAVKKLKNELLKSPDLITQRIYQSLLRKPPSGNLHWDPDQKKIIMIDALGF